MPSGLSVRSQRNRRLIVRRSCVNMATYKLWSPPGNKNAFKSLIAARYVGAKIEVPPMEMGKTNKTPEFLKLNPFGKVLDMDRTRNMVLLRQSAPWLFDTVAGPNTGDPTRRCLGKQCHRSVLGTIGGQGIVWKNSYRCGPFSLFSGQQSLHLYCKFAGSHSFAANLQAHVEQWIDFSTTEIDAPLCSWLYPLVYPNHFPHDQKVHF